MRKSKFDPQKHHRKSIRLRGYDYSSEGAYYVTIVTQGRERLFGEIRNAEMHLNNYGNIVQKWWNEIPTHFPNVELGSFVIMPNHFHGITFMTPEVPGGMTPPLRNPTLGQIIAYFKYQSTKEMNGIETGNVITRFWQRNYYEHIIRDERDLQNKTNYIVANPSMWADDENNSGADLL